MKLTSQMIKDKAKELGIDCIAIGNIERFKDAPPLMSPSSYFPGAKSVIAVAMRIPRGSYRGIEEGTHWHNYTFYSYNKLNSLFRPIKSYELCCFIEDHGWEAVAHYPAVPEGNGTTKKPVAPGKLLVSDPRRRAFPAADFCHHFIQIVFEGAVVDHAVAVLLIHMLGLKHDIVH